MNTSEGVSLFLRITPSLLLRIMQEMVYARIAILIELDNNL